MKKLILGITILSAISACKKIEGDGGRASISGNVVVHERLYINGICTDTVTYSGAKEDLYIIYGEGNTMYNDKIEASYVNGILQLVLPKKEEALPKEKRSIQIS